MPTAELLGYVAFNAPSPGIFAGQSYGNPQVKKDPRELSWLSPPAVSRWTTVLRTAASADAVACFDTLRGSTSTTSLVEH